MNTFIKIAFRNILRNKKRSAITVSAVGFGLGALIFLWAFAEGVHVQMIQNYTSYVTAQVQIQGKGYQDSQKLETYLTHDVAFLDTLKQHDGLVGYSPRIRGEALISSSEASSGSLILGVNPELEKQVSTLHNRLSKGKYISKNNEIVLGKSLARNLNVTLEDKIVIMGQALDGSIAGGAYYVTGLIDTGADEIDKGLAIITQEAAEELFVMQDKYNQLALKFNHVNDADAAATFFKEKNIITPEMEILTWREAAPALQQWVEYDNALVWMIVVVVMIVVAIGILNTILMGVLERTREFGILQAIGTKGSQIIMMIAWESIFLGVIGTLTGIFIGFGATALFAHVGIDLSLFTDALNSFYIDSIIYPAIHWPTMIVSIVMVLCTSFVVSIYPAWLASKLEPVEAIRSQ